MNRGTPAFLTLILFAGMWATAGATDPQTLYLNTFDDESSLDGLAVSAGDVLFVFDGQMVAPQINGGHAILNLGTVDGYDTTLDRNPGILVFGFNVSIEDTSQFNGGFFFGLSSTTDKPVNQGSVGYDIRGGTMVADRSIFGYYNSTMGLQHFLVDVTDGVPDLPLTGSVKITYHPYTRIWSVYIRVDSVYHDPITLGEEYKRGEAFNRDYTGQALPFLLFGRSGTDTCRMDNVSVSIVPVDHTLVSPGNPVAGDQISTDGIPVDWDSYAAADSFRIYRNTANDFSGAVQVGEAVANSFFDTTALPGVTYFYWINSVRQGKESGESAVAQGVRKFLSPPRNLTAGNQIDTDGIPLQWNAAEGARTYRVFRDTEDDFSGASPIAEVNGESHFDPVLPGLRYYYWVTAKSSVDESPESAGAIGVRGLLPVSGLSASMGEYSEKIALSWSPVQGASRYRLYRSTTNNFGDAIEIHNSTATDYEDLTIDNGIDYFYWIAAESGYASVAPTQSAKGGGSDYQPDLWIAGKNGTAVGIDLINFTGIDQTATSINRNRRAIIGTAWVSAIGATRDEVQITGSRGNRQFKTSYFANGNVTAAVLRGSHAAVTDPTVSSLVILVKPTSILRKKRGVRRYQVIIRANSINAPAAGDLVRLAAISLPKKKRRK